MATRSSRRQHPNLINEPPLIVMPTLATMIGLNEAIVLQQVHYWLGINATGQGGTTNIKEGRVWTYNSYEEWQKRNFPFWSEITVRRVFLSLEARKLLISRQFNTATGDCRKWYTIDYDAYDKIVKSDNNNDGDPCDQNDQTPPEQADPCDQNDQTPVINMIRPCDQNDRFSYTETTAETTTENTSDRFDADAENALPSESLGEDQRQPQSIRVSLSNMPAGEMPDPQRVLQTRQVIGKPAFASGLHDFKARMDRLWAQVTRKVGIHAAYQAAGRLPVDEFDALCKRLPLWFPYWDSMARNGEEQYIPHLSTFINQRRFTEDPPAERKAMPKAPVQVLAQDARRAEILAREAVRCPLHTSASAAPSPSPDAQPKKTLAELEQIQRDWLQKIKEIEDATDGPVDYIALLDM